MTTTPTSAGSSGLVDRAKNILLQPKAEWDRIAAEPADTNKMYMGYLLPLLVIGAVCAFIGMSLIGISFLVIPSARRSWQASLARRSGCRGLCRRLRDGFYCQHARA